MTVLQSLIDKQDSFELVRDQIAGLLVAELANQQALATAAAKDPLLWTMSVYVERDWPREQWLNAGPALTAATAPIVSIWVESSNRDDSKTTVPGARQAYDVTYLLDISARGVTSDEAGSGHRPADYDARANCHAAVRLVRNILSATENRKLQMPPGIVWAHPSFETIDFGPAELDETQPNISVWNARCRFRVTMNEFSPEYEGDILELIAIDISDHGGVILSTEIS